MTKNWIALCIVGFCLLPLSVGCGDSGTNVVEPDASTQMSEEELEAYNQAAAAGE